MQKNCKPVEGRAVLFAELVFLLLTSSVSSVCFRG